MATRTTPLTKRQVIDDEKFQDIELNPLMGGKSDANANGSNDMPTATNIDRQEMEHPEDYADEGGDDSNEKSRGDSAATALISQPLVACGAYAFCSVSMVLTNKSLASSYNHLIEGDLNLLLVVFQAIVAVVAVEGCRKMKWVEYPPASLDLMKQWAPVNFFFCLMLFTGMGSLEHNSVPMVTIFKNVTNMITFFGDYMYFDAKAEPLVLLAFGVMLSGAVAAAWNDISVGITGLMWMAANCFSCAAYVLYMKYATKNIKVPKFGMVYLNNVLCVCFLLPAALIRGEVTTFLSSQALHTFDYTSKNLFAGLIGFFLNFASLNCVSATGPTTYAIVGSMNKIPVAIIGYVIFDSKITPETWMFISVSMAGGFLYSYAKLRAKK